MKVEQIVKYFFRDIKDCSISPFGSGLIHRTFFLQHAEGDFILQEMNHKVFKKPEVVMQNIQLVASHLKEKKYPKSILTIRPSVDGHLFLKMKNGTYWRVFDFIKDTQYFSKANSTTHVYKTGQSFGEFLFYLKDLPIDKIEPSIPDFHNVDLRFKKLKKIIGDDSNPRVLKCKKEIEELLSWGFLIEKINALPLPTRIVHADPKINNLLFDKNEEVKAVIDWDTIMPGNVLLDFGDLVRTMACTLDEESVDFENVKISKPYFEALKKGFLEKTESWLTEVEKDNLMLGAQVIIYEQAIRFLTDYLEGDVYYKITDEENNWNRAKNQMMLLHSILG